MKTEGFTEGRNLLLIKNSKWHDRVFRTKEELQKLPGHKGDNWQYMWGNRSCPIFDGYFYGVGNSRIFQDCMESFSASTGSQLGTEYLCSSYGKEGEAYQYVFDACFCEEMFVPLAIESELENRWNTVTALTVFEPGGEYEVTWCRAIGDIEERHFNRGIYNTKGYFERREPEHIGEITGIDPTFWRYPKIIPYSDHNWVLFGEHKPYDGATCDICYSTQEITGQEWQTAEYRQWISHPGGEATANAGPGFVDEWGFPAYEDPIWWRYAEDLPPLPEEKYKAITKEVVDGYIEDAMAAPLVVGTKGPELDLEELEDMFYNPEPYQSSSKPTSSEDDDYYSTL